MRVRSVELRVLEESYRVKHNFVQTRELASFLLARTRSMPINIMAKTFVKVAEMHAMPNKTMQKVYG